MGRGLGLSARSLLVVDFWGWLLGPVGMLLSVPLTISAKIALEASPGTLWLARLLAPAQELADQTLERDENSPTQEQQREPVERPNIAKMQGYSSGEQPQDGRSIKLNTNENPYPPSPHVAAALKAFASDQLRVYPQPDARALRQAIADHHEISVDSVVITHAGDEALRLAVTTFVAPGGVVASTEPTYSLYPVLAQIQDARMFTLDLHDDWSLPNDFASNVNAAGSQLTCVVNPHAPSGYLNNMPTLQRLAEQLEGVLLVDEAYADFVVDELSMAALVANTKIAGATHL